MLYTLAVVHDLKTRPIKRKMDRNQTDYRLHAGPWIRSLARLSRCSTLQKLREKMTYSPGTRGLEPFVATLVAFGNAQAD